MSSGLAQDFTAERGKLLRAVDQIPPGQATFTFGWEDVPPRGLFLGGPLPGPDKDLPLLGASMRTLQGIADTMIATPSRRKILIYVGAGIPIQTGRGATPGGAEGPFTLDREVAFQLTTQRAALFNEMQRANIVVYPVSSIGSGGLQAYIASQVEARAIHLPEWPQHGILDPRTSLPPPGLTPLPEEVGRLMGGYGTDFLLESASNTGGVAVISNDFTSGIQRSFDENSSYYLLGYRPPDPRPNGKLHRLEVKVNRKDVIVRTRNLYAAESPTKTDQHGVPVPPPPPLATAIAGMLPTHDLPMDVVAVPVAIPGTAQTAVALTIGLHHLAVP